MTGQKTASGLSRTQLKAPATKPSTARGQSLAIPDRPELVSIAAAATLERRMASLISTITDIDEAEELRRRADALEVYLQGREGHPHAQGIARRAEARIGELLGQGEHGGKREQGTHGSLDSKRLRADFRALASKVRRGMLKYEMDGDDSPWRASRRALLLGVGAFSAEATGEYEWYTPSAYIELARRVMGGIDLDPASSQEANAVVGARRFFTAEDDGLSQPWKGRVWLNPPYSAPLVNRFCAKLRESYSEGGVSQAITLTYGATETGWFHALADVAAGVAFPRGRVPYWSTREGGSAPLKGSALFYIGPRLQAFRDEFDAVGITAAL